MYGGAKLTLVAMTPVIICYAIAFTDLAFMTHGISALTGFMKNAGVAGVFVYGFFEKFLIPTGLHHFVWSPFQLTQIGGTLNVDGGRLRHPAIFLAYMRHPDLTPVMNDALRFSQQGMTTIFGWRAHRWRFITPRSRRKRWQRRFCCRRLSPRC